MQSVRMLPLPHTLPRSARACRHMQSVHAAHLSAGYPRRIRCATCSPHPATPPRNPPGCLRRGTQRACPRCPPCGRASGGPRGTR
eukprot:86696-Chlamydomonas_euryale.AAC.2